MNVNRYSEYGAYEEMPYDVWTFQDGLPPPRITKQDGSPAFPGSLPKNLATGTESVASPKQRVTGVTAAVNAMMRIMQQHGVIRDVMSTEGDAAKLREQAFRALTGRGSYRGPLPIRNKYLLAERVVPGRVHPITGEVAR